VFTSRRSPDIPSRRNIKLRYAPIAAIFIVLFLYFLARYSFYFPLEHIALTGELPISAPEMITVGDTVNVTVGPVEVSDGTLVGLVMVGKHGPRVYRGIFEQGIAFFNIPAEHTMQPGHLAFIAASESARGEFSMTLRPNPQQLRTGDTNLYVSSQSIQ
jgi:hypothetical protein